jgi:cytochrome c-type biogenesis protein CcmH/NrfF
MVPPLLMLLLLLWLLPLLMLLLLVLVLPLVVSAIAIACEEHSIMFQQAASGCNRHAVLMSVSGGLWALLLLQPT